MSARELGRVEGTWVMVHDVPLHLAQGWHIVDDPSDGSGPRGFMLMQAPISLAACLTTKNQNPFQEQVAASA